MKSELVRFGAVMHNKNFVFQEDNARIHRSGKRKKKRLTDNNIALMKRPSRSPDESSIENLGMIVVWRFYEYGAQFKSITELYDGIQEVWHSLLESIIDNVMKCMEQRSIDVLQLGGVKTKY